MAHSKPIRKRRAPRYRQTKYNVEKRAVRRRIERQKKKSGRKEWKEVLLVIAGFIIAFAVIAYAFQMMTAHEEAVHEHHTGE